MVLHVRMLVFIQNHSHVEDQNHANKGIDDADGTTTSSR